jgi:ABC-type multidrug transport system fused ATPase/permease subunit
MIAISPTLSLYLSPMIPLLGGCTWFYGQYIKALSKQHLDVLAHSTHVATERFSGITTVLSFGQKRKEVTRYSNVIEAAYEYARKVAMYQGAFFGSSQFVGNITLLGVLWMGSMNVFGKSLFQYQPSC